MVPSRAAARILRATGLAVLVALATCRFALADEVESDDAERDLRVRIEGSFFGQPVDLTVAIAESIPPERTVATVLAADERELRELAAAVAKEARRLSLDDYGTFRLAVFAVDGLDLPRTKSPPRGQLRTVSESLRAGTWGESTRLLAVGALLRDMGLAAVPFTSTEGLALGIPTADKGLNARRITHSFTRTQQDRTRKISFTWLPWNGRARPGQAPPRGNAGLARMVRSLPFDQVLEGPQRSFAFRERELPGFTLRRVGEWELAWGRVSVDFTSRPDAAAYLDLFPEFDFVEQFRLAQGEIQLLDPQDSLVECAGRQTTEVDLVTGLMRALQGAFRYEPGNLTSLFEMLETREGDCDQLSLLLAAALVRLGYTTDELRVLSWPDHVELAIKPRLHAPSGGRFVTDDAHKFFIADLAYYRYAEDGLATTWGDLRPGQVLETATVLRLR